MLPKQIQYWFDYYLNAYPIAIFSNGLQGTFAQCCGAYKSLQILPQGISAAVCEKPIEDMIPDDPSYKGLKVYLNGDLGYEVKEASVPIDGGRFINLRWIERLPAMEDKTYQLNADKYTNNHNQQQ